MPSETQGHRQDLLPLNHLFEIVHEDADLLVINKPAGLVCHPTKGDEYSSLVGRIRLHFGKSSHLINRLDRETSGLVVVAKTDTAAGVLRKAWESRAVVKEYLAIVQGHPSQDSGCIATGLARDTASRVAIKDRVDPAGAAAETNYRVARRFTRDGLPFSLLEVSPKTGRKHQIRIHMAHLGHSIVGDKIYGPDEQLYLALVEGRLTEEDRRRLILPHHALHAQRLAFAWAGGTARFAAPPEVWFQEFAGLDQPASQLDFGR